MSVATLPKNAVPTNSSREPLLNWLRPALTSTVGSKLIVALTGLALTGFVFAHMAGNLLIFQGRDALNSYAEFLKHRPALLWAARIGLLAVFIIHVTLALRLYFRNRSARPERYAYEDTIQATWASRHMALTGIVILAFLIFHLMHYTFGVVSATSPHGTNYLDMKETLARADLADPARGRHDVYAMTVYGFRNVWVSIAYIVAQVFLGLHLGHGFASAFQSLGWSHPRIAPALRRTSWALAIILVAGNVSMPVAVMTRVVGSDVPG